MPGVALKDEVSSVACEDGAIGTVCAVDTWCTEFYPNKMEF